jgi:hypothetical protein
MSVTGTRPGTADEQANGGPRSDYWLEHCEGFHVSGPNGRVGFVESVVSSSEGAQGLFILTGLFRTRTVFVPMREVGSVAPRRARLELLVTPHVSRARVSRRVRGLYGLGRVSKREQAASQLAVAEGPTRREACT